MEVKYPVLVRRKYDTPSIAVTYRAKSTSLGFTVDAIRTLTLAFIQSWVLFQRHAL